MATRSIESLDSALFAPISQTEASRLLGSLAEDTVRTTYETTYSPIDNMPIVNLNKPCDCGTDRGVRV